MAGNDSEGLRYGTIETTEKYYLDWKEEDPSYDSKIDSKEKKYLPSLSCASSREELSGLLDCAIVRLLNKKRFLEIIHDFIVYDSGTKKTCRHNQYFGIKAAQKRIEKREGGIIWHTQGSGKSLTMVWLAKWIREHVQNSRVLIITDRTELDEQIEKVFKGVEEGIYRTKSGQDLIGVLNSSKEWLMCSLVHKFGTDEEQSNKATDEYIKELQKSIPENFKAKGDIFVFVDECHRTQSGELSFKPSSKPPQNTLTILEIIKLLLISKPPAKSTYTSSLSKIFAVQKISLVVCNDWNEVPPTVTLAESHQEHNRRFLQ